MVENPCKGICIFIVSGDGPGFCKGCYRTGNEKANWRDMTEGHKEITMKLIAIRKKKFPDLSVFEKKKEIPEPSFDPDDWRNYVCM